MRVQALSAIAMAMATAALAQTTSAAQCAAACTAAFDNCKAQPLENNAYCVSQYAGCLGYNPFASGAPSPTACISSTAAPSSYATPITDQCAAACTATFNNCKAQPLENNSYCASQYAICLGYNPFDTGAPSPTACISSYAVSTTAAPSSSATPITDKCAAACTATFDNCKAQPLENNAYCVSQYAGCLGYNPFASGAPAQIACVVKTSSSTSVATVSLAPTQTTSSSVKFTGAANSHQPAMGLLAIGILAVL